MAIRVVKIGDKVYRKNQRERGSFSSHRFNGDVSEGEIIKIGKKYAYAKFEDPSYRGKNPEKNPEKIPFNDLIEYSSDAQFFYDKDEFLEKEERTLAEIDIKKFFRWGNIQRISDEDVKTIRDILNKSWEDN